MSFQEYVGDRLWLILVDTVHSLVMYSYHKVYAKEAILSGKPEMAPAELAARLKMPVGEALVILYELTEEGKKR